MMKLLLTGCVLAMGITQPVLAAGSQKPVAATAAPQGEKLIQVGVDGMVCDVCAQSLKKTFAKEAGIKQTDISLEQKRLTLHLQPGQTIDDATIRKWVSYAGYKVSSIER